MSQQSEANMGGSRATRGVLLLADISGYTGFLQAVANAHGAEMATMTELPAAYPLITSLLDGIVSELVPPFHLSKLEGDAVFAYAADDSFDPRGESVVGTLRGCYADFRDRRDEAVKLMFCDCTACEGLNTLELKFVLHWGNYVVQSIAGHQELLGPDVTMAHLLLKNNVSGVVGCSAYAMLTQAAAQQLDVSVDVSTAHTESFPHYPPIDTHIFTM
ncbi:MAG TPA: DUF2652 domain-containing protein [Acidimicrobiales bacterium]|nr:DUF2652 domain-containing protein [Acidimicrobiales bacterium]